MSNGEHEIRTPKGLPVKSIEFFTAENQRKEA